MDRRAVTYDSVITVDAQHAGRMLADRHMGHRAVLELWGHQDSSTPRAGLDLLWTVTDVDVANGVGTVVTRANTPPPYRPRWAEEVTLREWTTRFDSGDTVAFRVELARQKSPSVPMPKQVRDALKDGADGSSREAGDGLCWRPNKVAVPEDELSDWVMTKLARSGADVEVQRAHPSTVWLSRKRGALPIVQVEAQGTVTDPESWNQAVATGVPGKGKSFGTGMITLHG